MITVRDLWQNFRIENKCIISLYDSEHNIYRIVYTGYIDDITEDIFNYHIAELDIYKGILEVYCK